MKSIESYSFHQTVKMNQVVHGSAVKVSDSFLKLSLKYVHQQFISFKYVAIK